ncbi:MAG: hypothetical protein QNJ63_12280 [Calothrix sp. MO_192.B10]|nr:hypothetical protein [Calothrix sp. MO_192.B10]
MEDRERKSLRSPTAGAPRHRETTPWSIANLNASSKGSTEFLQINSIGVDIIFGLILNNNDYHAQFYLNSHFWL